MGSDGLFDQVSHDEICDIVWDYRNKSAKETAQKLVALAVARWKSNEQFIDDCTCIVAYLQPIDN